MSYYNLSTVKLIILEKSISISIKYVLIKLSSGLVWSGANFHLSFHLKELSSAFISPFLWAFRRAFILPLVAPLP